MKKPVSELPVSEIYSHAAEAHQLERHLKLRSDFASEFGRPPAFVARAPGRANMIGDVFPLAIERDILMAVAFLPGPGALHVDLRNVSKRYANTSYDCDFAHPDTVHLAHSGSSRWANYFKVAQRGLQRYLPAEVQQRAKGKLLVLVDGDIPPENGLSSSAAMTICSIIAIVTAIEARELISRRTLTEIAVVSEREVGVNSGGMDQTVSMFGNKGAAVFISFVPELNATSIKLPATDDYCFLVANTMVASDKKVMGPVQYNLRVVETRLAARALMRILKVSAESPPKFRHMLRAVADSYWETYPDRWEQTLNKFADVRAAYDDCGETVAKLQAMLNLVEEHLPRRGLTREEVEDLVGVHGAEFEQEFLAAFPVRTHRYFLHARAFHAYSEAQRVLQFRHICERAVAAQERGDQIDMHRVYLRLGALMNASHESLRTSYECSSPELNLIVHLTRQHGALGSRLTGAGWGGCTISLVPTLKAPEIMTALRHSYYGQRFGALTPAEISANMFITKPSQGACIVRY